MNSKFLHKFSLFLLLMLLASTVIFAQDRKVTGKVIDESGPVPGVNVSIKGIPSNVSTNAEGVYTIQVKSDADVLVFSFIGYVRQQVIVGKQSKIDVTLVSENSTLNDVIVVGYGTKKRSEILGSIATVKAEDIQDLPVPNIAAALRNRLPGVGVSAVSGKPGSSITLNIRNSFASDQAKLNGVTTEPLYVINGITVTREEFDNLDPTMVEDISFLKDASAAIYGASGAKGVVLITTKVGKVGKPKISYTGFRGVSDATNKPDMLTAYQHASLLNDSYRIGNALPSNMFSDADLNQLKNSTTKSWFDELWDAAAVNRHTLNVSGGSEAITFFAGGNYYDEAGNYGGIRYNKYGFRSGMNAKINSQLSASVSLSVDYSKKESDTYKNGGENDQAFFQQLITTPLWVPIQIDGKPVNYNNNTNPLAVIQSGNNIYSKGQGLSINASLDYKPNFLKGLTARLQFGKSNRSGNDNQYVPPYVVYNFKRTGQNNLLFTNEVINTTTAVGLANTQLAPSTSTSSSYQGIFSLSYNKKIGEHSFDIMAAADQSESSSEGLGVYWRNQLLPGVDEYWAFDNSTFTLANRNIYETAKRSYIGRANYNFSNKYFFEAIARLDASSNFAPGNRWGLFPTIGLGWALSEEKFIKEKFKFISFMKLRANYGVVGEDRVDSRLWQSRYTVDPNGYSYNETLLSGVNPSIIPNPDISWEKARTLNLGLDASFLNNKFNLGIDVYHRYSYDVFDKGNNENFPMYAGFEAPLLNYGERVSWGSEFSVGYQTKLSKDWGFNSNVNFGFTNYRTDKMFYNQFQLWDNTYPDLKYMFGTDPRKYNSSNYGLISKGMLRTQADVDALLNKYPTYTINSKVPQVGWLYYEDINGDGKITEKDQTTMYESTNSKIGFGINLGVT
ncbi:MAG: SusC/RagA family TonB-linked outer membrane protein, partial [Pedobacter sp.]